MKVKKVNVIALNLVAFVANALPSTNSNGIEASIEKRDGPCGARETAICCSSTIDVGVLKNGWECISVSSLSSLH